MITIIEEKLNERVPTNIRVRRNGVGLLDVFNPTAPRKARDLDWEPVKLDFLLKLRHPAFLGNPTKATFSLIRSLYHHKNKRAL